METRYLVAAVFVVLMVLAGVHISSSNNTPPGRPDVIVNMYVQDADTRQLINDSTIVYVDQLSGESHTVVLERGAGSISLKKTPMVLIAPHYQATLSAPGYLTKEFNASFYDNTTMYLEL